MHVKSELPCWAVHISWRMLQSEASEAAVYVPSLHAERRQHATAAAKSPSQRAVQCLESGSASWLIPRLVLTILLLSTNRASNRQILILSVHVDYILRSEVSNSSVRRPTTH